ncbi:unnamed protein product [Meganyctiphanes norvegica]|uniref:Uncharacterized protein n=1 Tax=Meganyctiphanes norvegica TaxID=48144 RepID=A0AAV2SKA2_MEGNR
MQILCDAKMLFCYIDYNVLTNKNILILPGRIYWNEIITLWESAFHNFTHFLRKNVLQIDFNRFFHFKKWLGKLNYLYAKNIKTIFKYNVKSLQGKNEISRTLNIQCCKSLGMKYDVFYCFNSYNSRAFTTYYIIITVICSNRLDTDYFPLSNIADININIVKCICSINRQFRHFCSVDKQCCTHYFRKESNTIFVGDENCPCGVPKSTGGAVAAATAQTKSHIAYDSHDDYRSYSYYIPLGKLLVIDKITFMLTDIMYW